MRAFMSHIKERPDSLGALGNPARVAAIRGRMAESEARAIMAVTEPRGDAHDGCRHDGCPTHRDARAALAESLAAFVADVPPWDDDPRPFVSESAAPRCRSGRPLRVQRRPPQLALDGTSRPESRPTIRTEGREADGPLFTQDQDARERAEVRSQRRIF